MRDEEIYEKAVKRAEVNSCDVTIPSNIIIFLEKEIDDYRRKLAYAESRIHSLCNEQMQAIQLEQKDLHETTTLEAVQENRTTEIIKALADNGYNTITINCYKDIESEV